MLNFHKIYGRVLVLDDMDGPEKFVDVVLLNPRPNLSNVLTVGKAALKDQGNYTPRKENPSLVEQFLPIAYKMAGERSANRPDVEYEELLAVAALGLVEAASRFDPQRNNGFAAFCKPYISGFLTNYLNPERNGLMNKVDQRWQDYPDKTSVPTERSVMYSEVYSLLDRLTAKQKEVVIMHYYMQMTVMEIAERKGVKHPTVIESLSGAIATLREMYGHSPT